MSRGVRSLEWSSAGAPFHPSARSSQLFGQAARSLLRGCAIAPQAAPGASHTSNGIVSSQASISAASSRACLGPCGAITPTEFCRLEPGKDRSRERAMAQRRLGPRPFRPSDGRPRRIYSLTAVNRSLMFLTLEGPRSRAGRAGAGRHRCSAEVRGSNPLSSTKESAQIGVIS
jgi:hypothetical protein